MKVGIYRHMHCFAGGGFQYEMVMLKALGEIARRSQDELVCLVRPEENLHDMVNSGQLNFNGLPLEFLYQKPFEQGPLEAYLNKPPESVPDLDVETIYLDQNAGRLIRQAKIDWLFQLQTNQLAFSSLVPFVAPIHDLEHRIHPEFPEVSEEGQFIAREYIFGNCCRYATMILVDSEKGRQDVLNFYGRFIDSDRIRILPFFPPPRTGVMPNDQDIARVVAKYALPERYFFYPAQFWRHKNHILIVEALRKIEDRTGEKIPVVFCGTYVDRVRAHNFKAVMDYAEQIGVRERVHYLGWAPDEDMPALYRRSAGLVMPSYFGPTNIPALEAWHYNRPVITADIPGVREQIGDGGLLVDPSSADQLADAMLRLWHDKALADTLVERGHARLKTYSWDHFVDRVEALVNEVNQRVREGHTPRYPDAQF